MTESDGFSAEERAAESSSSTSRSPGSRAGSPSGQRIDGPVGALPLGTGVRQSLLGTNRDRRTSSSGGCSADSSGRPLARGPDDELGLRGIGPGSDHRGQCGLGHPPAASVAISKSMNSSPTPG